MRITRRQAVRILGAGTAGVLTSGFILPLGSGRHIITLSYDDGFRKSSIRTAEIYEKYGLSSCINIIANAHLRGDELPDEYHAWPVGDFELFRRVNCDALPAVHYLDGFNNFCPGSRGPLMLYTCLFDQPPC